MNRTPTRIAWMTVAIVAVAFLNARVANNVLGHWLAGIGADRLAPVARAIASLEATIGRYVPQSNVAQENDTLRHQVSDLQAQLAAADQAQQDAQFYRQAAGVRSRSTQEPLVAGVFSWPRQGGMREAIVNRGSRDGVAIGDVVVTANSAFVGVVHQVFTDHATVTVLGDPSLEIAGRVVGTAVTGLVHTDQSAELVLDLVQHSEDVREGQVIATSGDDQLPAGLIIGAVRAVDTTQTTLFSLVRIAPAVTTPVDGAVLVIRP